MAELSESLTNRRKAVNEILQRLKLFNGEGDPDTVLDAVMPVLSNVVEKSLVESTKQDDPLDVEAVATVVGVRWCRYCVLPPEQDVADLQTCLGWSVRLMSGAPDLVPRPILEHLGGDAEASTASRGISGYETLCAAVATTPRKQVDLPRRLLGLGTLMWIRSEPGGRLQDFDTVLDNNRTALGSVPQGHPDRLDRLRSVLIYLGTRFSRLQIRDDLEELIALGREALDLARPDDPELPSDLHRQGQHLFARFKATGDHDDLDAAIDHYHRMIALSESADLKEGHWANVCLALKSRFMAAGSVKDLNELITATRQMLDRLAFDAPLRSTVLAGLADSLFDRFNMLGQADDLNEAIASTRIALHDASLMPAKLFDRSTKLDHLGFFLKKRFDRFGRPDDLDAAITVLTEAWSSTPLADPDQFYYLSHLAEALRCRFDRIGQRSDIDHLVDALRATSEAMPHEHPEWPDLSSRLGIELRARFNRYGNMVDLEDAIVAMKAGLDATPSRHPGQPGRLSNLAGALTDRFKRTDRLEDLDESIALGRKAVKAVPNHTGYVSNLASNLWARSDRTGRQEDLVEAMELARRAAAPGAAVASTALAHHTLALTHQARFAQTGLLLDLEAAIIAERDALAAVAPGDTSERTTVLATLSGLLHDRFQEHGDDNDLEEAIELDRAAVASTPLAHPDLPGRLNTLSLGLSSRFERSARSEDLNEAIGIGRQALNSTSPEHPSHPLLLANLASTLRTRYVARGSRKDLDEAVRLARASADSTPNDHPDRTGRLSILGSTLYTRFERDERQEDLVDAIDAWRQSATTVNGPSGHRLEAAKAWARGAWEADGPGAGLDGFALAVEQLLPLRAWHGLDRTTREHHIKAAAGLASQAAACAISAGEDGRSLVLLEAGRSIMWTSALQVQDDLSRLAGQAPGLAAELEATRRALDRTSEHTQAEPRAAGRGVEVR